MDATQIAAIDRLLELLPTFEDPEFVPAVWPERFHIDAEGKRIEHVPYPDYHPAVEEFRNRYPALVAGIHPYDALPEDDTPDGVTFSVLGTTYDQAYFAKATIDQIRRYLMLLGRGERFCDGHIDGEFRAEKVVAALKRLAEMYR
ncbi:MAG: hypothetical protein H7Y17_04995 [Chlorobia bacterium]|nr:hypothetical protein [Fimbriimonadaceae bacterium]